MVNPREDDVWLVNLDPSNGAEIRKTRPSLVVSPDEMNQHLQTIIVAPMTKVTQPYPTRAVARFQGKSGQVTLDQIRAVRKKRLFRKLGRIAETTAAASSATLVRIFTRV